MTLLPLHLTPEKRAHFSLWIFHFTASLAKLEKKVTVKPEWSSKPFHSPDPEAVVAATSSPQLLALFTRVRGNEKNTQIND